jgi:Fic family protein
MDRLAPLLADIRFQQGRLLGQMEMLNASLQDAAAFDVLADDIVKTSEIEGDHLEPSQVRSSLARRLGMELAAAGKSTRHVDGVVEMILDATIRHAEPMTADRLFRWHAGLFPTGWSSSGKIESGAWRSGPMQVISGNFDRTRVHFEAPAAERLANEMQVFLDWFERPSDLDLVVKAGIAHLWFVTIHPFDDGNGRVARAVADLALARSENSRRRFYSMSTQILKERDDYYLRLELTQRGTLDITYWLSWFIACLGRALESAEATLATKIATARFWESFPVIDINRRQRKMLGLLLEGFDEPLTTSKWAKITHVSQDTAHRDIAGLIDAGVLRRNNASGRSSSYSLNRREQPREFTGG